MNIWIVSMECAGIVEAGGVKNVTYSLCKELSLLNHNVTLFIPVFKCNEWNLIKNRTENAVENINIFHCGKDELCSYDHAVCVDGDFKVVFLKHPAFLEKEGVYTYTENEQKMNPEFIKGFGHKDTLFMDSLFCKAVCEYGKYIPESELPQIIHCQDASTALVPVFAKKNELYKNSKTVVTIHNAGPAYHHNFSSIGEAAWYTNLSETELSYALNDFKVEPFLLAVGAGANLTTVSETYAEELMDPLNIDVTEGLSPIFNNRKISIKGITNGIDFERYNPADKSVSHLPYEFNPEENDFEGKLKCRKYFIEELQKSSIPGVKIFGNIESFDLEKEIFISYHGRVTNQKGISLLIKAVPVILNNFPEVRFVVAGQGEVSLEEQLKHLCNEYSGRIVFLNGYEQVAARMVNAIGDFIALPSFFEPCGLEDFISQIFGTLPVANSTGGLNKIVNYKTGFLYTNNTAENLISKLSEVITIKKYKPELIKKMAKEAAVYIHKNYLWKNVIETKYVKYFKEILKN